MNLSSIPVAPRDFAAYHTFRFRRVSVGAESIRMDKTWMLAVAVPLAVLGGTFALTALALEWLRRRDVLDRPVQRSSHHTPVPRGGGLAVVPLLAVGWIALAALGDSPAEAMPVALVACALAAFSFIDDLKGLPAAARLIGHFMAAALGVWLLPQGVTVFQGLLPLALDRVAATLLLVWFINLYNFMDGIDGITGIETACISLGAAWVLTLENGFGDGSAYLALTALAAAVGCRGAGTRENFLGDVGTVPLGFMGSFCCCLRRRAIGRRRYPAALVSHRCHHHPRPPHGARRTFLAGAPVAFLSARGGARRRPRRGGDADPRRKSDVAGAGVARRDPSPDGFGAGHRGDGRDAGRARRRAQGAD